MDDKPSEAPREAPASKPTASGQEPGAGLVTFTLDTASGHIVKLEVVDGSGARREPTADERTALIRKAGGSTLEDILEQTFEAGIISVLGDGAEDEEDEEAHETEEDATIRHLILAPMIERSAARRLMQREVLGRAVLATLVQDMGPEGGRRPAAGAAGAGPARARSASTSTSSRKPASRARARH
jgi:hypothetical protein